MRRSFFLSSGLLALAIALFSMTANAAEIVIKLASTATGTSIDMDIIEFLGKEIGKRAPGKVDFQSFAGGQLGTDRATISGLQAGTHIMSLQGSVMASIEPVYGVFEAPFLFDNRDQAKKAIRILEGDIKERLLKKNIVVLGIGELGFRQITNNIRPIVTPADLKGIKLRTPESPFRIQTFKTLGANPTPLSFSELFVALRSGVIDGQENPLTSIYGSKLYEVQKFISISNHVFTPNTIIASKIQWDKWPADVQKAVREASEAAAEFSFVRGQELDADLMAKMKADTQFNMIDFASFRKAAEPLYPEIEKLVGKDIWEKVRGAIK